MIGKVIGHYRVLSRLGEGGMGVVYQAEDLRLKRRVALKFLPPHLVDSREFMTRFLLEAQAAAALSHPNVCVIHEVGESDGQPFIAMEYVEGRTLRERVQAGSLDAGEAVALAIEVAAGLEEAHGKGIIHRDIKSANIMVTSQGRAKVMDFGLAKRTGGTSVTESHVVLGTVAYMSPEQARGKCWTSGPTSGRWGWCCTRWWPAGCRFRGTTPRNLPAPQILAGIRTYRLGLGGAWESWRRAIELNPNVATAQALYAHFLMIMGHREEALEHSQRAVELDPFNPLFHGWHAYVLYMQRRYEEAIAAAREALRFQPDFPVATSVLWFAMHEVEGMEKESFEFAKSYARVVYDDTRIDTALDEGYARGGYAEAMKRAAEALIARLPEVFCKPSDIAIFYAVAGEKDKALEWLEKAFEVRD